MEVVTERSRRQTCAVACGGCSFGTTRVCSHATHDCLTEDKVAGVAQQVCRRAGGHTAGTVRPAALRTLLRLRRLLMLVVRGQGRWRETGQRRRSLVSRILVELISHCPIILMLLIADCNRLICHLLVNRVILQLTLLQFSLSLFLQLEVLLGQSLLESRLLHVPVIHEVKVEAFAHECLAEHRYQLLIVRLLFKFELPRVVQEVLEFLGITPT